MVRWLNGLNSESKQVKFTYILWDSLGKRIQFPHLELDYNCRYQSPGHRHQQSQGLLLLQQFQQQAQRLLNLNPTDTSQLWKTTIH